MLRAMNLAGNFRFRQQLVPSASPSATAIHIYRMSPHLSRCSDHHVRDTHRPCQLWTPLEAALLQQRHPPVPPASGRGQLQRRSALQREPPGGLRVAAQQLPAIGLWTRWCVVTGSGKKKNFGAWSYVNNLHCTYSAILTLVKGYSKMLCKL